MPLPLNQKTNRGWIAVAAASAVAAYAVPFALNIAASGGRPTRIAAPVMLMFRRNRRLVSGMLCLRDGLKAVPYGTSLSYVASGFSYRTWRPASVTVRSVRLQLPYVASGFSRTFQ